MRRKLRYFPINTAHRGLLSSAGCNEKKSDYQKKLDGEAIASGSNADFIDRIFTKWSRDPNSVDEVRKRDLDGLNVYLKKISIVLFAVVARLLLRKNAHPGSEQQ